MNDEPSEQQLSEAKQRFDEHLKNSTMSQIVKDFIDQPFCSGYSTFSFEAEEENQESPLSPLGSTHPWSDVDL